MKSADGAARDRSRRRPRHTSDVYGSRPLDGGAVSLRSGGDRHMLRLTCHRLRDISRALDVIAGIIPAVAVEDFFMLAT